jgi:competence protein ComEC
MKRKLLLPLLLALAILFLASGFAQRGRAGSFDETARNSFAPLSLQVYVMDVGRGQSVLIISPTGKAALIDAGPPEAGSRVLSELRRRGAQKLEVMVATQAGADYIGGLRRVAGSSDLIISNFIDSAQPWKTDAYQQLLATIQIANIPIITARRGQFFALGGGARLDIVNPAGDGTWLEPVEGTSRENMNAVVVRLLYKEFVMLIAGGAGAASVEKIVEARQNIWAPFLVVGDNGSRDSLSEKMLSIVQPKYAIIPAATGKAIAPETIERLKAVKADIYRTDTNGAISISSDGKLHVITSERK